MVDLIYEELRNRLIPVAEKYANHMTGKRPTNEILQERWAAKWNLMFHTRMNELAKEEGLS